MRTDDSVRCAPTKETNRWKGIPLWRSRRGATYLEYALLAALVGIVGAVGLKYYGVQLKNLFKTLGDKTAQVVPKKS